MGASSVIERPWIYLLGTLGLIAVPLLIWVLRRIAEENRKERAGLSNLGALTNDQFDAYIKDLFERLGYEVSPAGGRESLGVDWILLDPHSIRTALQTRRWRQDVGPEAVEQIVGGAVYHRCDERLVVTTATFTNEARRLGRQTETRLWTLPELAGAMDSIRKGLPFLLPERRPGSEPLAEPEPAGSPAAPVGPPASAGQVAAASQPENVIPCPRCGRPMVRRAVNGRPVLVCEEFPRCTGARMQ